jgi:hypothetical protein
MAERTSKMASNIFYLGDLLFEIVLCTRNSVSGKFEIRLCTQPDFVRYVRVRHNERLLYKLKMGSEGTNRTRGKKRVSTFVLDPETGWSLQNVSDLLDYNNDKSHKTLLNLMRLGTPFMFRFKLFCDRRMVGQSVLVSGPHLAWPDLYYCRTFAVFMLWGALLDERTGL